jgi:hypothetical protein
VGEGAGVRGSGSRALAGGGTLQKLRWFRLGGEVSERQWRDIVSVLQTMAGELDDAYLQAVATSEDLVSLLDRARATRSRGDYFTRTVSDDVVW